MIQSFRCAGFYGPEVKNLLASAGVKREFTTPYHPQCDGMVERTNQSLIQILRSLSTDEVNWTDRLQAASDALNNASSSSTGRSPHFLMFGWERPAQAVTAPVNPTPEQSKLMLAEAERARSNLVTINQAKAAKTAAESPEHSYVRGNLVMVRRKMIHKEVNSKLRRGWVGPCVVLKTSPFGAVVQKLPSGFSGTSNYADIKRFNGQDHPQQQDT